MKKLFQAMPFFLALWFAPMQPWAAESPVGGASLGGRWLVSYLDARLGVVEGEAQMNADGSRAEIVFTDPVTRDPLRLISTRIERRKNRLTITLSGAAPAAKPAAFDPLGQDIEAAKPGVPIRLSLGDGQIKVPLRTALPAPGNSVEIELKIEGSKILSGTWRQRADAVTGRDDTGGGRVGHVAYDPAGGGLIYSGMETWRRPVAAIKYSFATENQFHYDSGGVTYPYPYPGGAMVPVGVLTQYREIYVRGTNLPRSRDDPIRITSLDSDVEYHVNSLRSDFTRQGFNDLALKTGDKKLLEAREKGLLDVEPRARDDIVMVKALLKPGVKPGLKSFRLNGAEASWLLRFGDHMAEFNFTREVRPGNTEPTNYVYRPQSIHIELKTLVEIPLDRLALNISVNDKFQLFKGTRRVYARKVPGKPRIFKSPPIMVVHPAQRARYPADILAVAVKPGDILRAVLEEGTYLNLVPEAAHAQVLHVPQDLAGALRSSPSLKSRSWKEALLTAAKCAEIEDAMQMGDSFNLTSAQADTFANAIIANSIKSVVYDDTSFIMRLSVSVGTHAAALMMHEALGHMLIAERESNRGLNNAQLLKLAESLAERIFIDELPIENFRVTAPDGSQVFFVTALMDDILKSRYGLDAAAIRTYRISAMREGLRKLNVSINEALEIVNEAEKCDIEELLQLTGHGMGAVRRLVTAAMVKLEDTFPADQGGGRRPAPQWVVDRHARVWLDAVEKIAASLREQRNLGRADTNQFLNAMSVTSLGAGLAVGSLRASVLVASAVLDVTELGFNAYTEIAQQVRERREVRFSRGAMSLIGVARYKQAKKNDSSWVTSAIQVMFSAFQAGKGTIDVAYNFRKFAIREARENALKKVKRMMDEEMKVPSADRAEVLAATLHARDLARTIGRDAMETLELSALKFGELVETGKFPPLRPVEKPWWAKSLSDKAFSRLGDMATDRDDIVRMVKDHANDMERLLLDDDALDILRLPQEGFETFSRNVTAFKARAPTRGPEFYSQAHPDHGNPERFRFRETEPAPDPDLGGRFTEVRTYAGQEAADGEILVSFFKRGAVPDTQFGGGREALVFDTAQTFRQARGRSAPVRRKPGTSGDVIPDRHHDGRPLVTHTAAPDWVLDVKIPLRPDRPGVPFAMFTNMRAFNKLGFEFADSRIGALYLKNVQSANTALELHWMMNKYPNLSASELFRFTHHYRYARNMAEQMGFRITEVRVDLGLDGVPITKSPRELVDGPWFDPGRIDGPDALGKARDKFIERYRVEGDEQAIIGFDVYMKLDPL